MTKTQDEVANWFAATDALHGANFGGEVFPGYPGMVVAEGQLRPDELGLSIGDEGKTGTTPSSLSRSTMRAPTSLAAFFGSTVSKNDAV